MTRAISRLRWVFLAGFATFLALPIVVVAGVSLNGSAQMIFPPQNAGWRWYEEFLTTPAWTDAFSRSALIAVLASVLSTAVALPIAYVNWRYNTGFARLLSTIGALPFLVPSIVVAIVFLLFWSVLGHVGRIENIIVSHAVTYLAIPLTMIGLGFAGIDREIVECSRTLGANERYVFRSVVLPLITPYVVSGMIFVVIFSLNEVLIAYMVGGFSTETLPVKVFTSLRSGFTPAMTVAAVLFFAIGVVGFLAVARIGNLPRLLGARD